MLAVRVRVRDAQVRLVGFVGAAEQTRERATGGPQRGAVIAVHIVFKGIGEGNGGKGEQLNA